MKSSRLLVSLAAVSLAAWSAGACSSSSDKNDNPTGGSSTGDTGNTPSGGQDNEGGSGGSGGSGKTAQAGAGEGGVAVGGVGGDADAPDGKAGERNEGGQAEGGAAGAAARCTEDCDPVVVLDPSPRNISRNVNLDVVNKVLVDQGSLYYWNYGYLPNKDYEYTILKTSVVPSDPPSDGMPALQTFAVDASPIQGAIFNGGYLYYSIKTGAATAEVRRKKLDTTDGTAGGTKQFTLDGTRIWRGIAVTPDAAYLTGEVDTNVGDLIKTGIYKLALPAANTNAIPTAITGLTALDNQVFDFTLVNGHLFWTQYDETTTHAFLWTAPVAGGNPVLLEDVTQFGGANIVGDPDGKYVYWTTHHHGGHVARCAINDLSMANLEEVDTVDNATEGMVVDEKYVYYMEDETFVTGKPIWRVPKAGGARELLAEVSGGFGLVAVDSGFVYFQDFDNLVYRVSKLP